MNLVNIHHIHKLVSAVSRNKKINVAAVTPSLHDIISVPDVFLSFNDNFGDFGDFGDFGNFGTENDLDNDFVCEWFGLFGLFAMFYVMFLVILVLLINDIGSNVGVSRSGDFGDSGNFGLVLILILILFEY